VKDRLFYSHRGAFCIQLLSEKKEQAGKVTNSKYLSFSFYNNNLSEKYERRES